MTSTDSKNNTGTSLGHQLFLALSSLSHPSNARMYDPGVYLDKRYPGSAGQFVAATFGVRTMLANDRAIREEEYKKRCKKAESDHKFKKEWNKAKKKYTKKMNPVYRQGSDVLARLVTWWKEGRIAAKDLTDCAHHILDIRGELKRLREHLRLWSIEELNTFDPRKVHFEERFQPTDRYAASSFL